MSTKTRRPMATPSSKTAATPKRKPAANSGAASKKAVLDNFDLEVGHRTRDMRAHLDAALASFLSLVDSEVLKIPRAMRTMTLGELEACWAGNFADTNRALAEKRFQNDHPERDQAAELAAAAKRKREVQSPFESSTPRRSTKSARTKATKTPAGGTPATSTSKRRVVRKTKLTKLTLPAASGASTLPQDHVFNPLLPKTPASKNPRAPKRHESFFSANGSPVDLGADTESGDDDSELDQGKSESEEEEEDEDELPDPEAMERKALAASRSASSRATDNKSSSQRNHKVKRAPSLIFRQSLGGGAALPRSKAQQHLGTSDDDEGHGEEGDSASAEIPLSDGRTIAFNPLNLTPGRIDHELAEGGLSDTEKKRVKARVQEEVVRALTERMERWKGM